MSTKGATPYELGLTLGVTKVGVPGPSPSQVKKVLGAVGVESQPGLNILVYAGLFLTGKSND